MVERLVSENSVRMFLPISLMWVLITYLISDKPLELVTFLRTKSLKRYCLRGLPGWFIPATLNKR